MLKKQPACGPWLHLKIKVQWEHSRESLQRVSGAAVHRVALAAGGRKLPVPSERGGIMVMEGDEAGRCRLASMSGFHMSIKVSMCPAEDAQEAIGSVRPGWNAGTGGSSGVGAGLSDSQRTPHAGPVLSVLQAAG